MAYHSKKRLYKNTEDEMIFGVCSGISEYLKIDVTIIRILALLIGLTYGTGLLLYVILALFLPDKSSIEKDKK